MIFTFIPFEPDHLLPIQRDLQGAQAMLADWDLPGTYGRFTHLPGLAWTATVDDMPAGAAGVRFKWQGTGVAWAIVSKNIPRPAWHRIVSKSREAISLGHACGMRRVEAHVRSDFRGGRQFVRALGFHREGEHRLYGPDGCDYVSYARFSDGEIPLGR